MSRLDQLVALDHKYQRAAKRAEAIRVERNALIRELAADGIRLSELARTLDVTRARIAQIVDSE